MTMLIDVTYFKNDDSYGSFHQIEAIQFYVGELAEATNAILVTWHDGEEEVTDLRSVIVVFTG
jgi:hypothetical protein